MKAPSNVQLEPVMAGRAGGALIAGSGVVLPILGRLAAVYNVEGPGEVRVAPSIGSGGGLAALRDGAIDCAVVSREVSAQEMGDWRVIPFARSAVILAAGQDVPDPSIRLPRLLALYMMGTPVHRNCTGRWSPTGCITPGLTPFVPEEGREGSLPAAQDNRTTQRSRP